jgi:tRNA(Ile)-lysidine synthase
MLLATIQETIRKYSLLTSGDRVVVAVSGGPDSVCLLDVLQTFTKQLQLSLHVAHLDHMFRGEESAAEARFVAGLAKELGIPATVEKIDVPAYCRERGMPAQAGAREVRYGFLSRVAAEVNADRIATGHTATDQAETFLLRLIRGAGVSGLSGIPPKRGNIIRPLIEVTREDVLEHLRARGVASVSDPSNRKPVYTRNRIRLDILPVLKQFNPRIVETLASEADLLRDEDEAVETCLQTLTEGLVEEVSDSVVLKRRQFNELPPAFKRRVLKKAVRAAGGASSRMSSVQIDEAVAFLSEAQTGRAMHLPFSLTLEREYEAFVIRRRGGAEPYSHTLVVPGISIVPEPGLEVETVLVDSMTGQNRTEDSVAENYFWQALFDYDKIPGKLTLRSRLPGDRFCPAGMGGKSKKLQDFFIDAKVPKRKRDTVPLFAAGESILWIMGFRTDERFQPGPETKRMLIVRVRGSSKESAESAADSRMHKRKAGGDDQW